MTDPEFWDKGQYGDFVGLLKDWELIEGETIAINSFKIRAQNALKNNFNQNKIDRNIEYKDNKLLGYQQQLDAEDGNWKPKIYRTK